MDIPTRSGHSRGHSHDDRRRIAVPRKTARGPLDQDVDDPLSAASVLSPASPQSLQTASPSLSSPNTSTPNRALSPFGDARSHNLSHLLQPTNFQSLPPSTTPTSQPLSPTLTTPESLLEAGDYHSAATAAAHLLTHRTTPTDHTTIFRLWYLRLCALILSSQTDIAAAEAKTLGDFNNAAVYRHPSTHDHLAPWGLRVLAMRLQALGPGGDFRRTVMGYYELAREARDQCLPLPPPPPPPPPASRKAPPIAAGAEKEKREADRALWAARLRELGLLVADALVEMGDLEGAARHLASLREGSKSLDEALAVREALVWLRVGDLLQARRCLRLAAKEEEEEGESEEGGGAGSARSKSASILHALILTAEGDAPAANEAWSKLRERFPEDEVVKMNAAVLAVYINDVTAARDLLRELAAENGITDPGDTKATGERQALKRTMAVNLGTVMELTSGFRRKPTGR